MPAAQRKVRRYLGRVGQGDGFTIPAKQPAKRIDYIWIAKDKSLVPLRVWVPRSDASDHLPVVAEFAFPLTGLSGEPLSRAGRGLEGNPVDVVRLRLGYFTVGRGSSAGAGGDVVHGADGVFSAVGTDRESVVFQIGRDVLGGW